MIFLEEDFTEGEYRSALAVVERRDSGPDCGRQEGGRFGPGNKCQEDAGEGEQDKPSPSSRGPSNPDSGFSGGGLRWRPGDTMPDVFAESVASNPTVRTADGKGIKSTSIPGAVVTRALGGKYEVDPLSVGRYLAARQAEHRGRPIDTTKPLSGDDFEYMVSGITSQVESAMARGVAPNFYSPEDRKAQVEEYAKVQPLMRGGRTASGFCIGKEGPNGECEPTDGISPQAEFLFRAAQALTSPQSTPFINMGTTDKVLTKFFSETDPAKARLGLGVSVPGAAAPEVKKNFERLQKIIDRIGLDETQRLFAGPPMRAGDFERFFLSQIPGSEGAAYKPNEYAVDEVVPRFSIFGPKVGPFFANNTGDKDALTADVWFTRTWSRLSGELIVESSRENAKKHASKLMGLTGEVNRDVLASVGLDGRQFRTQLSQMKKSGVTPQSVVSWADKNFRKFSKDGFPSPKKGNATEGRHKVDSLSRSILQNQTKVMEVPKTTVMRTNMIRVMKEASRRTGVPVAYMQDILWQDEQDAWGTLGSRTTTVPGEPSLYSDVIRKIVQDPNRLAKLSGDAGRKKVAKRSLDEFDDSFEYEFLSDQKGGVEQALYDDFISEMDDDEFADLAIAFLKSSRVGASRAFCPTGDGGGLDNSCSAYQGSHKPPSESYGAPAHDLARLLPEDVYSSDAGRLYGHGDPSLDEKTASIIRSMKGKPDAPVRIYRAVPKKAGDAINSGDWVTVNQDYAKQHGESTLRGDYKIVSKVVTAKDIYTNGDSIHEWGYRPSERRAFCPTGEDGGIDNSCGGKEGGSPGGDKQSGGSPKTYTPDPTSDNDGDGVTDAARVGVPAFDVPPPPKIGRLPGLDKHESAVEDAFIKHYESDPDKVASQFLEVVTKSGEPPTFGTDDAKCLTDAWSDPDPDRRAESRATLNCALHQTANAIAKRSFLQHLDTLSEGDEIMVTVGGCGAGKGFALKHDATALEAKGRAKAVWDSAGDQNATENPWILKEAEERGLKVTFVYVHADPKTQWADPNRGVVKRASDPKDGRMVDAKVFADSYAIGARNHHAFHQANKENPSARFIFLDNTGKPKQIDGVPQAALDLDADELAKFASDTVAKADVPPRVKAGGTIGDRIWGRKKK